MYTRDVHTSRNKTNDQAFFSIILFFYIFYWHVTRHAPGLIDFGQRRMACKIVVVNFAQTNRAPIWRRKERKRKKTKRKQIRYINFDILVVNRIWRLASQQGFD